MAETEHARKLGQLQESIQANIELTSSLSQAQNEIKSHFQSREDTVQADMGALVQNMALGSLYPRLRSIMDSYQQLSLSPVRFQANDARIPELISYIAAPN